jgi:NTE family protein
VKRKLLVTLLILFIFTFSLFSSYPKVALVLSGGGARGLAHIPIIEELERHGIPIDIVLGTSMGSLVGGLYAAGYSPNDLRKLIDQTDLIAALAVGAIPPLKLEPIVMRRYRDNLFALEFDKAGVGAAPGLIGDQRIINILNDSLSRVATTDNFDNLDIPFRAIAADLISGKKLVFSSGSLVSAIRGSISIPILFNPYPIGDNLAIDGGLVDNLPIVLARELGADIVIAVDVNAVDYEITEQDLASFSATLWQLVVMLTKNTVLDQLDEADLLISPLLHKQGILDFHKAAEILELGGETALLHSEDFKQLAILISETRELNYKDPNRLGSYFALDDVYIGSVTHKSLDNIGQPFDLEPFNKHLGSQLDLTRKLLLQKQFEDLRQKLRYATITYTFNHPVEAEDGTIWGNLEIQSRKFPTKRSTISAGIFGATSLIFDKAGKTQFDFKPDVSLRYNLYSTVDWTLHIQNDDALKISTKVGKDFLKYWQSELSIAYTTGGIHPENLRSSFSGTVYRDRSVDSYLALSFIYAEKFLLRGVANLDYIWYGHQDFGDSNLIHSYQIESLYSTLPFGFFPNRGFRFDLSALAEVIPHFGYKIESRIQSAIPIGANDVIGIDIHAGSAFTNQRRKSAYFDYGGLRSIVTYPVTTLTDQMVTAQLKHTHTLKEQPIFIALRSTLAAGVKGTILNEAGSSASLGDLPPVPFSQLKSWDFSASVALGLSFATIDLLFGVAIDNNLKVALFLEVI